MSALFRPLLLPSILGMSAVAMPSAQAQNFRFTLRAEPDVIPANGISTTSIFVQLPQNRDSISSNSVVRFATTAGVIESQATLSGGVARVLLRSAQEPGTAIVTAFIGSSREAISVEFSEDNGLTERYLEVAAPYVAYGSNVNILTAAGKTALDFGALHIESDVRLDVDLASERVWAQGNKDGVLIRQGSGDKAKWLRGDRLYYDLRRRRGVIRRAEGDTSGGPTGARQEFMGASFEAPPRELDSNSAKTGAPPLSPAPSQALQTLDQTTGFLVPTAPPTAPLEARDGVEVSPDAAPPANPANVSPAENAARVDENLSSTNATSATPTLAPAGESSIESASAKPELSVANTQKALTKENESPIAKQETSSTKENAPKGEAQNTSSTKENALDDEAELAANARKLLGDQFTFATNDGEIFANGASSTKAKTSSANEKPLSTNESKLAIDNGASSTKAKTSTSKSNRATNDRASSTNTELSTNDSALAIDDRASSTKTETASGADPITIVPGSPADTPAAPQEQETRSAPLVTQPRPEVGATANVAIPDYAPLPPSKFNPIVVELPPPSIDTAQGYWVAARRVTVYPRDKVQFQRASVYFNGAKAFGAPIYVLPLDGSFNPETDLVAFNSSGGFSLKVPFYYQASKSGTGALTLRRDPGAGFSSQKGGFSLELDQQYYLSPRSSGRLGIDQIGHGAWNLNFQHLQQLDARTNATLFVNMPRHRDLFARASVTRDLSKLQIGLEGFYDRVDDESNFFSSDSVAPSNLRGQFYARMRPREIGKSGWNYTLGFNALAVQNVATGEEDGIGIGGGLGGVGGGASTNRARFRSLFGQTLGASFGSPTYAPWQGASVNARLSMTAFNYSGGRRGASPGVTLGYAQRLGQTNLRLDYTYDRSSLGLYGSTGASFTHYLSASVASQLTPRLGFSSFLSKSLSDDSMYGSADLSYALGAKMRAGLFADYSSFTSSTKDLNYGWSIGRSIAGREVSVNYDVQRGKVYFEIGNGRY